MSTLLEERVAIDAEEVSGLQMRLIHIRRLVHPHFVFNAVL